mmetsp:Transcript_41694/g.90826  ORF Transcript_41694/g.90826 Transcript_41694/m.90826 type:complete len:442 (-) Transcript_41694:865-2190(-)
MPVNTQTLHKHPRGKGETSVVTDRSRGTLETIRVHEAGPRRIESLDESILALGELKRNGLELSIVLQQQISLQHEEVLSFCLVLFLASSLNQKLLVVFEQEVFEVIVRKLGRVGSPGSLESRTIFVHGTNGVSSTHQRHKLPIRQTHDLDTVLQQNDRVGLRVHRLLQVLGPRSVLGISAATAEGQRSRSRVLKSRVSCQDNKIGPRQPISELFLDGCEQSKRLVQSGVRWPVFLGREPHARSIATTLIVGVAERRSARPSEPRQQSRPRSRCVPLASKSFFDLCLDFPKVCEMLRSWRQRKLPVLRGGHVFADAAGHGPHVASSEFVPRVGEGISILLRVFSKLFHDLLITSCWVCRQTDVAGQHANVLLPCCGVLHAPLMLATWSDKDFPLVVDQLLEVLIIPLGWFWGPLEFESAGVGIPAFACATLSRPGVEGIFLW